MILLPLILNVETATKNCSVCLFEDKEIIAIKEQNDGKYSHSENLHVFINELLKSVNKTIAEVDAIAVSKGPGSYTGLRIGVSAAKGFCFSLDKPLIAVSTLTALAHSIKVEKEAFIVSMLDARRMEVYSAVFDGSYNKVREVKAEIIDADSFRTFLDKNKVYFLGDGAEKCKPIITHKNAIFLGGYFPSAKEMAMLSYKKYVEKKFEDVAYFEPFYLKDFLVTVSKKLK